MLVLLSSRRYLPSREDAVRLRDRAAGYLAVDSALAYRIARAFCRNIASAGRGIDPEIRAIALRARAEASAYTGRLRDAKRDYERATAAAEEAGAPVLLGEILVGRVGVLGAVGESAESIRVARRAQRLLERHNAPAYLGKLFMNLGNTAYHEERYADASKWYARAAGAMEAAKLRDASWVALLINAGVAATHLSRIDEAHDLFSRAESTCMDLGLARVLAQARFNRAFLERLRGDYRRALALLESAGETFSAQDARDMVAATMQTRAEIHLELFMPADAASLAANAAETFTREGMTLDAMLCRLTEAGACLLLGRDREAAALAATAEAFFAGNRNWPRRAAALLLRAEAQLAHRDPHEAVRTARRALRAFTAHRRVHQSTRARRFIAEALLAADRVAQADRVVNDGVGGVERMAPGERSQWWEIAARVSLACGRRGEARARFERAVSALEAQRQLIPGLAYRAASFGARVSVYDAFIRLLLDEPEPSFADLFALVGSARGRAFRDRMSLPPAARRGIDAERARLGSLTRRLESAEYAPRGAREAAVVRALRSEIRSLERRIADSLRRLDPGSDPEAPPPSLQSVKRRLREDDALVQYFVAGERLLGFVVTKRHSVWRVLPVPPGEIHGRLEDLWFQLDSLAVTGGRPIGELGFMRRITDQILAALYDALVRPLEPWLPPRGRIVVVPHERLHHVPFECLHDGSAYADDRWQFARLPTAEWLALRKRRTSDGASCLVCGTVRQGPAFVAREVDAVAARIGEPGTRVLRDPPTASLLERLGDARLVHFSTHGVFRDDNPMFSRLSTGDGALFVADLLGAQLRADLVVLSACNSGRVFPGRGDDLSAVAHAFLAAGARRLVASLWRVHDEATLAHMDAFYDALIGKRLDPAAALHEARVRVRDRWNHPFYWGAFSVHGV